MYTDKISVKTILQTESNECGLACLAMIASTYGLQVDLVSLRHQFPISLKGINLSQLINIAGRLNLQSRSLRLEIDHLSHLATPCILHWDMNHFVVLKSIHNNKATILDPAFGERRLSLNELSTHFTGIAVELSPTIEFKSKDIRKSISIRQLVEKVNGLFSSTAQLFILSIALQFFLIISPIYMQWTIDQALVAMDSNLLLVLAFGFGLAIAIQVGISLLRGWMIIHISSHLGLHWMRNIFTHLLRLPLDFFEKRHIGDITSRMGSIQTIQRTLTVSFIEAIIDGIMTAATLALMFIYSWKLACITMTAMFFYIGIRYIAYRPFRDCSEQQLVSLGKRQTHLLESIRGIQSIKIAGREPLRESVYSNLLVDTINQEIRIAKMNLGFLNAQQFIFGIERIIVIFVGATLILQNSFSVGMLVAYLVYKEQFSTRVGSLIDKWVDLKMLRLHGERLSDILLTPTEKTQENISIIPSNESDIIVDNLSFRYSEEENWILKNCSFSIASGESVAITGSSGCGKTTLFKLLLGLLEPSGGKIRIAGMDVTQKGARNVRDMIGVVMQDDQLFAGSIAENISFFSNDVDQERIQTTAKLAAVHDDIMEMPMRYHSTIGDMGSSLSGGQKQRIILARAIYLNPKFLFLDEATSHLDITKEKLINEAVKSLKITRIIVAHRPDTIASADRTLLMKDGKIIELRNKKIKK